MNPLPQSKPLYWMASSKSDLKALPAPVMKLFGFGLYLAQVGGKHPQAKPLQGFGGRAENRERTEMTLKKRAKSRLHVKASSGNVYADLGLKDADQLLVKAELVAVIASLIEDRKLNQSSAADLLGLTQPKLSNLLQGRFRGFSERRLMDCLTRLGRDVQIVVKATPRSRGLGRLSVVVM